MSGGKAGPHADDLAWFKSSCSAGDGGQCVEVATGSGALYACDSNHEAGPVVSLMPEAWAEFVGFATRHTA